MKTEGERSRRSGNKYILRDITTDEKRTFNSLKEIAEYTGLNASLFVANNKGTTVAKRWRVSKVEPPFEYETFIHRNEDIDYYAIRRRIQQKIRAAHTEGIVYMDESSRHNSVYWDIHIKNPSEDLIREIKEMIDAK